MEPTTNPGGDLFSIWTGQQVIVKWLAMRSWMFGNMLKYVTRLQPVCNRARTLMLPLYEAAEKIHGLSIQAPESRQDKALHMSRGTTSRRGHCTKQKCYQKRDVNRMFSCTR